MTWELVAQPICRNIPALLAFSITLGKMSSRTCRRRARTGLQLVPLYRRCLCVGIEDFDLKAAFKIRERFFPCPVTILNTGRGQDPDHRKSFTPPLKANVFLCGLRDWNQAWQGAQPCILFWAFPHCLCCIFLHLESGAYLALLLRGLINPSICRVLWTCRNEMLLP